MFHPPHVALALSPFFLGPQGFSQASCMFIGSLLVTRSSLQDHGTRCCEHKSTFTVSNPRKLQLNPAHGPHQERRTCLYDLQYVGRLTESSCGLTCFQFNLRLRALFFSIPSEHFSSAGAISSHICGRHCKAKLFYHLRQPNLNAPSRFLRRWVPSLQ
ncbi:hypothetical protein BGW80DRAFT_1289921 [Lactifluus volemus]|nr:hypothetical protein BGW80DRAFT_1289921 [Lactifluus volemus]